MTCAFPASSIVAAQALQSSQGTTSAATRLFGTTQTNKSRNAGGNLEVTRLFLVSRSAFSCADQESESHPPYNDSSAGGEPSAMRYSARGGVAAGRGHFKVREEPSAWKHSL